MNYRIISAFCVAFVLAIYPIIAVNGQSTDSLLYLLYNGLVNEDDDKYALLCEIASNSDDADTILKYSEQAIQLAEKLGRSPARPTIYKGQGYLNSGQLASALECFMKAANYYQADQNNIGMATAYNYIAETYNQIEDHDNEKYYLNNAIDIFRKEKDSIRLAGALHNLGYANYGMGQYDTAIILFSETSKIYQILGSDYLTEYAYCLGNSGLVYSRQSEFEKAEDYLLRAIEILTEQGDIRAVIEYMIEYAGILQQKGEIEKAIGFADISFNNAAKNSIIEYERDAAYRLAQLYQISGNIDSAYHYQSFYIEANDSIISDENIHKMAHLWIDIEVAKKQAEIDVLQKNKILQRIVIAGLILILLLATGLILLYYYSLKRSKKLTASLEERRILLEKREQELQEVNTLLEEQKEELLQQKEELQSTLENLKKTQGQLVESEKMAAVGGLVAGVAHEMNTPIGVGITAISNLKDDIQEIAGLYEKDKISRKDFKGFLESTDEIAKLIQKNLERAASLIQSFMQVSTDQV
ncbi:MAG: tetratricopeptide repeat protein, partial [Bacteroidales bacterium]|nr:tetratricopeptide repeat protein [Bacteroidales bacterium]